jgi:hypothetical protein
MDPGMAGAERSESGSTAGRDAGLRALPPVVWCLAVATFLVVWGASLFGFGGIFIDEAYYLACADHPALGYVDHPPLSVLLLAGLRALLGDSIPVLRLLPALAGGGAVLLAGLLARRLGAGSWGAGMAGLAVGAAPMLLVLFDFYSMNAFSVLFWSGIFLLLVTLEQRDEPRLWLAVGALAGVGLQNKHTLALLFVGLGVGMLATRARRHLMSPWLWAGAGLAALLVAPNLLWQHQHDWASLEFYRQADLLKNNPTPALEVLALQVVSANPVAVPLWLAGLGFLLFSTRAGSLRHLGIAYLMLLALLVVGGKSRPDRIAGFYPLLFAAGGAALDRALRGRALAWLRVAYPALLALAGLALLPLALPVLPPEQAAHYAAELGLVPKIEGGEGKRSVLPQWLADRYEWPQLVEDVEAVLAGLSPAEREHAVIFGSGYGHVAPLAYLTQGKSLPPVYSRHNTYFFWGPPPEPVETVIVLGLGDRVEDGSLQPEPLLADLFADLELARIHHCRFCMSWRDDMPIWIARSPRRPLAEVWPEIRRYL